MSENHAPNAAQAVERRVDDTAAAEIPASELSKEKLDTVAGGAVTWRDVCDALGIPVME
jgi:hypothetical protein